jgi:hypothetical protein
MFHKKLSCMVFIISAFSSNVTLAENWVFVPSKENACHIRVFYDQDEVKNNRLVEKYDLSESTDCDKQLNKQKLLVVHNELNCDKQQLAEISRTIYFKDGRVSKTLTQHKSLYLPQGTPALLLNAACKPKFKK